MVPPMERGGYRKTRMTFLTKGQDRWIRSCLCQLSSQFDQFLDLQQDLSLSSRAIILSGLSLALMCDFHMTMYKIIDIIGVTLAESVFYKFHPLYPFCQDESCWQQSFIAILTDDFLCRGTGLYPSYISQQSSYHNSSSYVGNQTIFSTELLSIYFMYYC